MLCPSLIHLSSFPSTGLEVIKLEVILRLKIKRNDWLLADMSASSQSLRLILNLRLFSSFITLRPGSLAPCQETVQQ